MWKSCANVALHHSVRQQMSTTWKRELRDGEPREPPTFNWDAAMLDFIKTAPRLFTTFLHSDSPRLTESVCLVLRTTADAGRRESTRDTLAKIIHAASNTRCKITQKKKEKDYVKSRQDNTRPLKCWQPPISNSVLIMSLISTEHTHTTAHPSYADNWRILSRSGCCRLSSAAMEIIKKEQSVADKPPCGSS